MFDKKRLLGWLKRYRDRHNHYSGAMIFGVEDLEYLVDLVEKDIKLEG